MNDLLMQTKRRIEREYCKAKNHSDDKIRLCELHKKISRDIIEANSKAKAKRDNGDAS